MNTDIILFGGLLLDRYFEVDRWPGRGQDGFFQKEDSFVGGCAINMAATIHNLGGQAHIVSGVGSDEIGRSIRRYMEEHGLSQTLLEEVPGLTGSCLVFSEPDGERTFLTRKGAEMHYPISLTDKALAIRPGCVGVTGYYLLGPDGEDILSCLEQLAKQGARILFDPSSLAGEIPTEWLERILAISTVMTPNETELSVLGGLDAVSAFVRAGKTVILKKGAQGGRVYSPEETFDYTSVLCEAVDTTGAGDSFSGALLYAMTQGLSQREGVLLAARCAAKTVQIHGPHGFWKLEE